MKDPRRARADSKLDNLPRALFLQLRDKLLSREIASYREAVEWVAAEASVSTQVSSVWSFYQRHCKPIREQEQKFAAMRAEAVAESFQKHEVDYDAVGVSMVKQKFFEFMESPEPDVAAVKALAGIIFKDRQTKNDTLKVNLQVKEDLEKGLDALIAELKGNDRATAKFEELKQLLESA